MSAADRRESAATSFGSLALSGQRGIGDAPDYRLGIGADGIHGRPVLARNCVCDARTEAHTTSKVSTMRLIRYK
jgi:hypothetical protein